MRMLEPAWPPGESRLEHERRQAFGCPVDRRGQTCRSRSDDHQVINLLLQWSADAQLFGQLAV